MNYYRGLIIVSPHGSYIISKKKTLIVKSRKYNSLLNKKLLLIENKIALGYIKLSNMKEINITQFNTLKQKHKITDEERSKWWPGKKILYSYDVTILQIFKNSIKVDYLTGPQVSIMPNNIKIIK
jgi:hypothetical protein